MRILWAMDYNCHADGHLGGGVFSTQLLVKGLKALGHTVMTMNPVWPENRLPWYVNRVRTAKRFARGLRRTFERCPPTVVVAQNHVYPYVVREAKRAGVPVVIIARDKRYRCPQFSTEYMGCSGKCARCVGKMALLPYPWFRHHVNMCREMAMASDAQVTVSKHMADDMRTWLPGTDPMVIPPPWDGSEAPDEWVPRDVLFLGKGHYKGADLVLEMARRMEMTNPDIRFRICGGQEFEHEMGFRALTNVDYLGFVDRRVAYERARVLVCPARWDEPSSRSIVEAASIGIPSIVSEVGGQGEMQGLGGISLESAEDIDQWCLAIEAMTRVFLFWSCNSVLAMNHVADYHVGVAADRLEKVLEGVRL